MSLQGISFATQGVETFLPGLMMLDPQHFMSKLEGHAIQGLKGSGKNHAQRVTQTRGHLQKVINDKLAEIVGDPNTVMKWKYYWRDIVTKHHVKVEGWPESIPFKNLSDSSCALHVLESLLDKWESGKVHWRTITDHEFKELEKEYKKAIEDRTEEAPEPRRQQSDKGKKRAAPDTQAAGRPNKRAQHMSANTPGNGDQNDRVDATHSGETSAVHLPPDIRIQPPDEQLAHTNFGLAEVGNGFDLGEEFDYELFDSFLEQICHETPVWPGGDPQQGSSTGMAF